MSRVAYQRCGDFRRQGNELAIAKQQRTSRVQLEWSELILPLRHEIHTRQFIDVNATAAAGYQPLFGCVSSPDHGAMGVHYVNVTLVGDGEIDESHPEALIYERSKGGLQLVGVEYIVDAATWLSHHSAPPMLEGQAFQFVGSPNRYGLSAFFELHVWAWRENPKGAFVDWNNRVTCEGQ